MYITILFCEQVQPLDNTLLGAGEMEMRHNPRNPPSMLSREYTDLLIQKLRHQKAAAVSTHEKFYKITSWPAAKT